MNDIYKRNELHSRNLRCSCKIENHGLYSTRCSLFLGFQHLQDFSSAICVQPDPVYNAASYIRPVTSDCHTAYRVIPQYSDLSRAYSRHIIIKPQLRVPPFTGISDFLSTGIVQLPKIWSFGKLAQYDEKYIH